MRLDLGLPKTFSAHLLAERRPIRYDPVDVPIISSFFGIYIRMYHDDHAPPHIHAEYQGHEALIALSSGDILEGHLPKRASRIVKEWCLEHDAELTANWEKAVALLPLDRIAGADND